MTDFCDDHDTRAGAEQIARDIKAHWAKRGFDVRTKLIPATSEERANSVTWSVRSDMHNGQPVRRLAVAA